MPGDTAVAFFLCPAITITPPTLPQMQVGVPYSVQLVGAGGLAPYTWAVTGGALPAGLVLDAVTGIISGTPTAGGPFSFTVQATDDLGCTGTVLYSGDIPNCTSTIVIEPVLLPTATQTVPSTGDTSMPYGIGTGTVGSSDRRYIRPMQAIGGNHRTRT